jgi:transposase-like protein
VTALATLRRNFRRIVDAYQAALDAADPCDYSAALRQWSKLRRELLPPPNDTDASLVGRIAAPVKRELDRADWPIVDTAADMMVELLWTQPVPGLVETTDCIRDARRRCDDVFRKAVRALSRLDDLAELIGETQNEGVKPRRRLPAAEVNVAVGDYLRSYAADPYSVTIREVARAIGVSAATVANTTSWKAFERGRKEARGKRGREVPLTDGLIAVIPDRDSELAKLIQSQAADMRRDRRRGRCG